MKIGCVVGIGLWLAPAAAMAAPAAEPIPRAEAARVFAEARQICEADDGRLWGRSLCGPMMFVDPDSRTVVANQADAQGVLKPDGRVFSGKLAPSDVVANTATNWRGVLWTQILWPDLAGLDPSARRVLLAHELYHRIQPELGAPFRSDGGNAHLDTLQGRYLLELEWRALDRALAAKTSREQLRAIHDALAFRAERYRLFPRAAEEERALERLEGLAEYTGVKAGLPDRAAQIAYARRDIATYSHKPSFVRAFAYGTGPAYGLLLDTYAPDWRRRANSGIGLDQLLRAAVPPEAHPLPLSVRAAAYGGPALLAAEEVRDRDRKARIKALHARFVEGPVLVTPKPDQYEFNPNTVLPLPDVGVFYPHFVAKGAWGVLKAEDGAVLRPERAGVIVSAAGFDPAALKGDGWSLTLAPGWRIAPGPRPGDFTIAPSSR